MGINPCPCWNLKDGCVTVGIWSLVFSVVQLGLFGWQTAAIKDELDRSRNYMWGFKRPWRGDQERRYQEGFQQNQLSDQLTAVFIVQILLLIVSFFLLFASVALIYGVHTESRYLVWPYFPCAVLNILLCLAYCVTWWMATLTGYWMVLTIIEIIGVIVNVYCFICVFAQYGRIGRAPSDEKLNAYYYEDKLAPAPVDAVVYFDQQRQQQQHVQAAQQQPYMPPAPAYDGGFHNMGYEPVEQAHKVHIYGGYEGQPQQQTNAQQQPAGTIEDYTNAWLYNQSVPAAANYQNTGAAAWQQQQQQPQPPQYATAVPTTAAPYNPPPDAAQHMHTEPATPAKLQGAADGTAKPADELRPTRSEPEFVGGRRRGGHQRARSADRHQHRSAHRRRADRAAYSSDSERSDDDSATAGKRSRCSRHRHHSSRSAHQHNHRHQPSGRHAQHSTHRRQRRRHASGAETDEAAATVAPATVPSASGDELRRRTMRDVKRGAREVQQQAQRRPDTSQSTPTTAADVRTVGGGRSPAGGITIPQKIVIPPSKAGRKEPQRFHINSEITISYSDRSTNASEPGAAAGAAAAVKRRQQQQAIAAAPAASDGAAPAGSKSRPVSFESHGSTAV